MTIKSSRLNFQAPSARNNFKKFLITPLSKLILESNLQRNLWMIKSRTLVKWVKIRWRYMTLEISNLLLMQKLISRILKHQRCFKISTLKSNGSNRVDAVPMKISTETLKWSFRLKSTFWNTMLETLELNFQLQVRRTSQAQEMQRSQTISKVLCTKSLSTWNQNFNIFWKTAMTKV